MSEHVPCSPDEGKNILRAQARAIVLWAGSLTDDGEEIGGIKEQLRRAARLLRLHEGVVWRAYQRRSGPEIYPCIDAARNELIARIASNLARHRADIIPLPKRAAPNSGLPVKPIRSDPQRRRAKAGT